MQNHFIAVMGTMGSGKSTAAKLISRHTHMRLVKEKFEQNVFLPKFYADQKRWAFHSQMFFLTEKVRQTLQVTRMLETQSVIQDVPIVADVYSYAKAQHVLGNMDDDEWKLYLKAYRSFEPYLTKPDLIIYLDTSIKNLLMRIKARGRGYEKSIPESYLRVLDRLSKAWLQKHKQLDIIVVNTNMLDFAHMQSAKVAFLDQVLNRLKEF